MFTTKCMAGATKVLQLGMDFLIYDLHIICFTVSVNIVTLKDTINHPFYDYSRKVYLFVKNTEIKSPTQDGV